LSDHESTVLVVDDVPAFRELVATVLRQAGYRVREAGTAEEALGLAAEERPALVLLDVVLPGVSGYELCRRLREQFGSALPIIFVSGARTDALDSVAGMLLGADDYITKPFDTGDLVARVRRCIERASAAATGVAGRNGMTEPMYGLTPRELEVLQLLVDGLGTQAIAGRLVISDKTVATHVQRIMTKLGVHSRAAAVAHAYRLGLVAEVEAHLLADALEVEPLDLGAADFDP
jgi:DNA-binding NarL/FixJ family response regulator